MKSSFSILPHKTRVDFLSTQHSARSLSQQLPPQLTICAVCTPPDAPASSINRPFPSFSLFSTNKKSPPRTETQWRFFDRTHARGNADLLIPVGKQHRNTPIVTEFLVRKGTYLNSRCRNARFHQRVTYGVNTAIAQVQIARIGAT
jgi:hypothetical protein